MVVRQIMTNAQSIQEAIKIVENSDLIIDSDFFIVGQNDDEGVILRKWETD